MWNCAKLGVLGASANKYADWAGVLINGSHSGWIAPIIAILRESMAKSGTIAVARVAICRTWLNAAPHDAAYPQTEMK
jgi:hypothetical protein